MTTEPRESGGLATSSTSAVSPLFAQNEAAGQNPHWVPVVCGAIELRVTRSGTPARRLRINASRCTFGSGEGCTVRLSDSSLRPLHAVILREAGQVLLRGYTTAIEINGRFSIESFLEVGDVFRLGHYYFEMIPLVDSAADEAALGSKPAVRGRQATASAIADQGSAPAKDLLGRSDDRGTGPEQLKRLRFAPERHSTSAGGASQLGVVLGQGASIASNDSSVSNLIAVHLQAKRNAELLSELGTVRHREQEIRQQLAEAIGRYEHSQQQAAQASEAVSDLQSRITTLTEQMDALAAESEARRTKTSQEQAKLRGAIAASQEAEAASHKAELASRKAESEAQRQRDAALTQRDAALAQRAEAIDREQAVQAQMRQASQQIQQLTQQCAQASALLDQAQQEVSQGRATIDELQSRCRSQADAVARDRQEHAEVVAKNATQIDKLNDQIRHLQQELDQSQQRGEDAEIDQLNLATIRANLDTTLQQHVAEKLSWQEQITDLQETIQQLSDELATAVGRLSESETRYAELQSEVGSVHQRLVAAEQEVAARPSLQQWDDLREQLAQAEAQLAQTETQLAQLRADYGRLQDDHDQSLQSQHADQTADPEPMEPSHWHVPASQVFQETPVEDQLSDDLPTPASPDSAWHPQGSSETEPEQWQETDCTVAIPESLIRDSASGSNWLAPIPQQPLDEATAPANEALLDQPAEDFDQPAEDFDQPAEDFEHPAHQFDRPTAGLDDSVDEFDLPNAENDGEQPDVEESEFAPLAKMLVQQLQEPQRSEPELEWSSEAPLAQQGFDEPLMSSGGVPAADEICLPEVEEFQRPGDLEEVPEVAAGEHEESHLFCQQRKQRAFNERAFRDSLASSVGEIAEDATDGYGYETSVGASADALSEGGHASGQDVAEDEDSVEAYMSRLLQRMGHASAESAPEPKPVRPVSAPASAGSSEADAEAAVFQPLGDLKGSEEMAAPLSPRSQAPESHGHLDAMRQLANESAQSAISVSNQGQAREMKSQALINLLQASVVLICSAVFFYCGQKNPTLKYVWHTAGTLACGLAMFFMYDMARKLVAATQTGRVGSPQANSQDEADES